jgi:hypothetical protein
MMRKEAAWFVTAWLIMAGLRCAAAAPKEPANLAPNASFETVQPATAEQTNAAAPSSTAGRPAAWEVWVEGGAEFRYPDDARRAHGGRRCAMFRALQGLGSIRCGPIRIADQRLLSIKVWTRGRGKVLVRAWVFTDQKSTLLQAWPITLGPGWTLGAFDFKPPKDCRAWWLDIANDGPAEFAVDDVFVAPLPVESAGGKE